MLLQDTAVINLFASALQNKQGIEITLICDNTILCEKGTIHPCNTKTHNLTWWCVAGSSLFVVKKGKLSKW